MKKVISIIMAALMSATSVAQVKVSHSSVNPKMSELFDELTRLGRAPRVQKTGGMEQWGNLQQLHYSVRLWFRPDLWYSRQRKEEPSVLDSLLRAEKTSFEKQVKAIRRTLDKLEKEAQDKSLYDNQKSGKDTIYYALNLSHDTTRVYKLQEGNHTYYNSDEFLDFTLKSGKQEGTFEGRLSYTVTLPGIDLSSNTYSWGDMIDDIESLMSKHSISHRNSFWQHDDAYSHAVWDDDESEDREAWMNIVNYGEYAYAGVTEAKFYSLTEDQKQLAQQLLAAIDSMAQKFTNSRQGRYYEYYYGASFEGRPSKMLTVHTRDISEQTNSIQVRAANHGYHFLILNTRGVEWIPTEWYSLKSFVNGKKTYFEGMAPKE